MVAIQSLFAGWKITDHFAQAQVEGFHPSAKKAWLTSWAFSHSGTCVARPANCWREIPETFEAVLRVQLSRGCCLSLNYTRGEVTKGLIKGFSSSLSGIRGAHFVCPQTLCRGHNYQERCLFPSICRKCGAREIMYGGVEGGGRFSQLKRSCPSDRIGVVE